MGPDRSQALGVPQFDRHYFASHERVTQIGSGELGGKASGLILARQVLDSVPEFPEIEVGIPRMAVIATGVFDAFLDRNRLLEVACSDLPDDRKAHAFQQGDLPVEIVGDLRALVEEARVPLAVRSSSLLEDALQHPFAGVYETKMTPNRDHDAGTRFQRLAEAVKLVWASTFFRSATSFRVAVGCGEADEKMAVIVQEIVGSRHDQRFYPVLSGVGRSWNFYTSARARPEEGVVSLALGLGKTIVDGAVCWTYSPARPAAPPPFASAADRLKGTQAHFWAVNMSKPARYDPLSETEYLIRATLADADYDGVLGAVASTYDPQSDRLSPGTATPGPRVLDFAPILVLRELPLNDLIRALLEVSAAALGEAVEIEFAVDIDRSARPVARVGFLQVRPMMSGAGETVDLTPAQWSRSEVLLASDQALGNGVVDTIRDIVYVLPETFEAARSRSIARQVERFNQALFGEGRPYLLIGFGRWGSSDPWLGIPVGWDQICGAKVVVEAMIPAMNVEPSQGAHFFHNLTSFGVLYLTVAEASAWNIDWEWLERQEAIASTEEVRHVRLAEPLRIEVDGRSGRGVIWHD